MKGYASILVCVLLAMVCWGIYGPLLTSGTVGMVKDLTGVRPNPLPPFICVGLAYFAIAVVGPILLLNAIGERGHWSSTGVLWSMVAGASGAVGALCLILALKNGGSPIYVMPLVFGGAPVVNSLLTIVLARSWKQVGPAFIAGLIIVMVGAVTVMVFAPTSHGPSQAKGLELAPLAIVLFFTACTAVCFGAYGPTLHKGQVGMAGSRLRPFLCVGIAYFLIAVLVPGGLLAASQQAVHWSAGGVFWSLAGGAAGAIGALGIILAFNFGGKPVYVMPLVFGGAPVVNTFVSLIQQGTMGQIGAVFIAGLILVAVGAVTVLVFAPRGHDPAPAAEKSPAAKPAAAAKETRKPV